MPRKADGRDEAVSRHWLELEDLYSKRLWHQLTLKIQTFIRHESFKTTGLFEMYECFIADFEHKHDRLQFSSCTLRLPLLKSGVSLLYVILSLQT
ncbi:26S proteasome non-ATPase regulatory subunit 13 [Geodia barretti]|uniref:26S proteasome non-ATPase regulatory subunit 13 n=1 Tax=Geodia barretti TaxID=519541 RepID=A0AA35TZH0_GEOBA|nr:26S proteasome non-ATPase regulatory subunit 13 [Geodia barretti]